MNILPFTALASIGLVCFTVAASASETTPAPLDFPQPNPKQLVTVNGSPDFQARRHTWTSEALLVTATAVEPIPGSLIFSKQPSTKRTKAPIGSPVFHEFRLDGRKYREIYLIQSDRSLKLITRTSNGD